MRRDERLGRAVATLASSFECLSLDLAEATRSLQNFASTLLMSEQDEAERLAEHTGAADGAMQIVRNRGGLEG